MVKKNKQNKTKQIRFSNNNQQKRGNKIFHDKRDHLLSKDNQTRTISIFLISSK